MEKDTTMLSAKFKALKNYLIETGGATPEELDVGAIAVYNVNWKTFEIIGNEYKVFTDRDADEEAADYIKGSLWAFNADFILEHSEATKGMTDREYEETEKALKMVQSSMCESCNALVGALISDLQQFIVDAIDADGRGHYIASYDGEEHESGEFYIYRTN